MRRPNLFAIAIVAGSLCATTNMIHAASVTLPTTQTALYLTGDIPNPFWVTFALDANIQLLPPGGDGQTSFYILNIKLSNDTGTTGVQFAKIDGIEVDNGYYEVGNAPRLLFSDAVRNLYIDPSASFFNALLISAVLTATLPEGLSFESAVSVAEVLVEREVAEIETPIPAAGLLFATGLGGLGMLTWRRSRRRKAA